MAPLFLGGPMPLHNLADVNIPNDAGPCVQAFLDPAGLGLATSVPASGQVQSAVIPTNGFRTFAFGLQSTQGGSVSVQRYIDAAGTIPQGAPLTATLTAGVAAVVNATDGAPCQSMQVTVSNTGTSAATLSNVGLLAQAR